MKSLLPAAFLLAALLGCPKNSDLNPSNNNNTNGTDSYIKATVASSLAFAAVGTIMQVNGLHSTPDPEDAPAHLLLRGDVNNN